LFGHRRRHDEKGRVRATGSGDTAAAAAGAARRGRGDHHPRGRHRGADRRGWTQAALPPRSTSLVSVYLCKGRAEDSRYRPHLGAEITDETDASAHAADYDARYDVHAQLNARRVCCAGLILSTQALGD
jgi:hypothetical protein